MTTRMEDGREILARGRIRVDARRALEKLREHLLVDLHLYAVEVARAAVASKATFIDVDWDADDVVLAFDGEPVPAEDLPRLLDHVLSDGGGSARVLRGLALGVNAALGLGPAFVDIHTREGGDSRASRLRFVPSILAGADTALPSIEEVAPPKGMPERGTRVHVRRRMGLDILKRAATRELPREISLLADALHEAPLSLRRSGAPFPHSPRNPALLRVSFRERDMRRGVVEILASPPSGPPTIEFLELGVTLLRRPFAAEPVFPSAPHGQIELPVRVVVDADELPTNASRSALREDAIMPKRAEASAQAALADAIRTLITLVTGQGKPLSNVEVLERDPARLEDALGALVCVVAGAVSRGAEITDEARALLDLPLLRNACGGAMTAASLLERGKKGPVFVHEGAEPLAEELLPWLDDVVWLRDRVVERVLVDFSLSGAAARLDAAKAGLERRRKLHSRPSTEPSLPLLAEHVVRETFHVKDGPFRGLRGQLALGAEGLGSGQRPSTVRVYVEGRHIDTITIDRDKLPLVMDAAIAWDGHIFPRFSYEGVSDSEGLRLALFQLTRLSMLALGSHIERVIEQKKTAERERITPLAIAAVGSFVSAAEALGVDNVPAEPLLSAYTPLWTRGFWPSADPDRLRISLAELKTYFDRTHAICCVPPGTTGVAPDGRPVVAATDLELEWLQKIFVGATLVPYAKGLRPPRSEVVTNVRMFQELSAARRKNAPFAEVLPSMPFQVRDGRGIVSPALVDEILWIHAGVLLATAATEKFIEPATFVVEHDAIVPTPSWDGITWTRDAGFLVPVRNELLRRIVAALEGDAEARGSLVDFPSDSPGPVLRAFLVEAVARHRGSELATRIEALRLVHILDEDGRPRLASLSEIDKVHPEPRSIPWLAAPPDFPTFEWRPVICEHEREARAFARWAGGRAKDAKDELGTRRSGARLARDRRTFLEKKPLDPLVPGHLADPDGLAALWYDEVETRESMTVAAALPRKGLVLSVAEIEVLLERRKLCERQLARLPIPVVARVSLVSEALAVPFTDLNAAGVSTAEARVFSAACSLAAGLVKRAEGDAWAGFFGDIRVLRLALSLYKTRVDDAVAPDLLQLDFALRAAEFRWPTVQGDARALAELVPGGKKLFYGRLRYDVFRGPARGGSELDAPIVFLPQTPEGDLAREILAAMGHEMVDVTDAVEALQKKRSGEGASGVVLPGSPLHPALRTSLAKLKADLDGEIELSAGPVAEVHVENLRGEVITLNIEGQFPFRARARVEDVEIDDNDKRDIAIRLTKAAKLHLESLADRLDELPPFVRESLRRVVVAHSRKDKTLAKKRLAMRVFPDILGGFHSLAELDTGGESRYPYVTFPPPHPAQPRPRPPLWLTTDEASAIQSRVLLEDVSQAVRRELLSEERRRAAPLAAIALDREQRSKCLEVVPYRGEQGEGEVGILAPEHADARGIWVHKTRRPLCRLPDGFGWPLLAVINDDSIPENRSFDGIKGQGPRDGLRSRVQKEASEVYSKWFHAPHGVLSERRVHLEIPGVPLFVTGVLWLPASWTQAGRIEVRDASSKIPAPRYFVLSKPHFDGTVPVCGRILVAQVGPGQITPEKVYEAISAWLVSETLTLVSGIGELEAPAGVVDGYRWILRFLGENDGNGLDAKAGDGRRIDAAEIISLVTQGETIWYTRHEGTAEGHFPGASPPFVLVDDGAPLFEVLRFRTKALRELGRVPERFMKATAHVPPALSPADDVMISVKPMAELALPLGVPRKTPVETTPAPFIAPDVLEAPPADDADDEPASSFFRGLVQRVVLLFERPEPPDPATRAIGPTLVSAIDKLGLAPTSVVSGVRYARSGRPIGYDEKTGKLVLNRSHPGVRALAARANTDARARILLVAAAVREINRVLEVVTDATEQRVLFALLRGDAV